MARLIIGDVSYVIFAMLSQKLHTLRVYLKRGGRLMSDLLYLMPWDGMEENCQEKLGKRQGNIPAEVYIKSNKYCHSFCLRDLFVISVVNFFDPEVKTC